MTTGAIVQARMGSTRLPGKVMKKVEGEPLLFYVLERLHQSDLLDRVIVATTEQPRDDQIAEYVDKRTASCFRGPEHDVLRRYRECAESYDLDTIVRVTADCPLLDARILDRCLRTYGENPDVYLCNFHPRTYPDGMDLEVFPRSILKRASENASSEQAREHVTPWIRNYSSLSMNASEALIEGINIEHPIDFSHVRLTVDYPEDLEVVRFLIENTELDAHWQKYIALLTKYPEYIERNRKHVKHSSCSG